MNEDVYLKLSKCRPAVLLNDAPVTCESVIQTVLLTDLLLFSITRTSRLTDRT